MSSKTHWTEVYKNKDAQSVSWYQPHAMTSLQLIQQAGSALDRCIIDVGGGASTLVDELLALGYRELSVLDISGSALDVARARLGNQANSVTWIEGDITAVALPEQAFDIWHDRAVFHFLTDLAARQLYVAQLKRALKPGGHAILATFAEDGPEKCSGLPVMRYSTETLSREIGTSFELVRHLDENHVTPGGSAQHFIYCVYRKTDL